MAHGQSRKSGATLRSRAWRADGPRWGRGPSLYRETK
jgi:hypothetical protein